ncbi:Oidioi.mRNA.OKI2018_I69.chr1.g3209.t1.cds [Oikopleura dioica]|uniref:Oidioi.mRNA.OKI2018_I69.chr1.g3209.t1.cds n=1 Tax=Oikopleura dioica TaxID=34765 RepID=A0ABN7SYS6_OIKDI|nr:Oidioi.mRNA.OKI2018_I69.chr1.g3209.t1.cds [Oikopleura dioica]
MTKNALRNIDISGPSLISTETLNSEKDGENHYSIGVLVKIDNKEEAYKLDPSKSLDEIVTEVMQILQATNDKLENSLKVKGTPRALLLETQNSRRYITEELLKSNRIDKGSTLLLGTSPDRLASHILKLLSQQRSPDDAKNWHQNLSYLLQYSEDIVFNRIFISKNGLKVLLSVDKEVQEANLEKILTILMALLDDNLIDYKDILSHISDFTDQLIKLLNERTNNGQGKLLQKTINLLDRGLQEVPAVRAQIFKLLNDSPILHTRISDKEENIQLASLMLVNSVLFMSREGLYTLIEASWNSSNRYLEFRILIERDNEQIDNALLNKLKQRIFNSLIKLGRLKEESAVGTFQRIYLKLKYEKDITTRGDPQSTQQQQVISKVVKNLEKESWETVISGNSSNHPLTDFQTPVGILPLKCIEFFSRKHRDDCLTIITNNATRHKGMFPIVPAANEVVSILVDSLDFKGSQTISSEFHELVFGISSDTFEEIFSATFMSFWATWRDANAVMADFKKVVNVLKEQVKNSLTQNTSTLQQFKKNLAQNNYNSLVEAQHIFKDDADLENHQSVLLVKEHLRKEVTKVVEENRLMLMEKTCRFTDANQKKSFVYMRLDKSRRHISVDSKSSTFEGAFSSSSAKHVQIRNMIRVYQGVEAKPVVEKTGKHKRKMIDYSLLFAIEHKVAEGESQTMTLLADSSSTRNTWVDGLKSLLSVNFAPSESFTADVDHLLQLRLKIQLIDFQEIRIPTQFKRIDSLQPPPEEWTQSPNR